MVISPASISARLITFAWLGDRPSASRCIEADGQTIGRPPLPQSCGWVKRNSQSTACTSRGDSPSRGDAALKAASSCPGRLTPSGRPAKPSAVRSALSRLGVRRRKPVGAPARPSPRASRALSIVIAILRSGGSRRANLSLQRKRQFPLDDEAADGYVGGVRPIDVAVRLVANFAKARPARRAFAFSGGLLGGCPLLLDQLQTRLAAVAQAMAVLELVEKIHSFARQIERDLPIAGGHLALAIGSDVLCDLGAGFHRRGFDSITSKPLSNRKIRLSTVSCARVALTR